MVNPPTLSAPLQIRPTAIKFQAHHGILHATCKGHLTNRILNLVIAPWSRPRKWVYWTPIDTTNRSEWRLSKLESNISPTASAMDEQMFPRQSNNTDIGLSSCWFEASLEPITNDGRLDFVGSNFHMVPVTDDNSKSQARIISRRSSAGVKES
jgi:hypothetical protein